MYKNKIKASLIHLLLSAIVISALISLTLIFWFPTPFLGVTNFKDIALMLIVIDLILGPLLTFVVFNPMKKNLRFDLSVIVAIQIMGLSYGTYMLYLTHPVYVTYYDDSFNIITATHARPEKAKLDEFRISTLSSPRLAYMQVPDKETEDKIFNDMFDGDVDIEARVDYYKPYDEYYDKVIASSLDAAKIFSEKNMNDVTKEFLEKNNYIDNFAFFPLINGSTNNGIIVLNKKTGEPVTMIKTSPWKYVKKQ